MTVKSLSLMDAIFFFGFLFSCIVFPTETGTYNEIPLDFWFPFSSDLYRKFSRVADHIPPPLALPTPLGLVHHLGSVDRNRT
ncbi:hypothetical protein B0H19DRAFT_1117748 [Mycena capillaripes]|nr:hypothetical protein B0H19DRAFT_1117748 [Mycena capillaripes]